MTTLQQAPSTGLTSDEADPKEQYYGGQTPPENPQGGYPQGGYSQGGYPQGGYPQGGYPQGGYPQGGYPQGGYPQGGYPQGSGYPGAQQVTYPPYPAAPGQQGFVAPPPTMAPPYVAFPPHPPPPFMHGGRGFPADPSQGFYDQEIRRNFIRKVYSLLMCQLAVTTAIIGVFTYHEPTNKYIRHNVILTWSSLGAVIVTMLCLACCADVRRKSPMNFIFLGIFTLAESVMLGCFAALFEKKEVLMAAGITAVVCLALTMFAFQTKYDFTVCGAGLFAALIVLLIFGILCLFLQSKISVILYASCGALLFSIYLVYDTQLILGGKHKYSISPEEYIFATLNLYLDIVYIFINILTIIGLVRN